MTCDTDDYNDPYKIDIYVKDGYQTGKFKGFFEKRLNALLDDEYFLLLYVPEDGGRMQVVRPASDSYHRKCMIKRINETKRGVPSFYYALSHLWGLKKDNRFLWKGIRKHVDDEEGRPMKPISMRPEKRHTLLSMLRDHPDSYWWIDVLCARTDTPLDIMGDIYACCLQCIAMIDCEPALISNIHTKLEAVEEIKKLLKRKRRPYLTNKELHQTKASQLIDLLDTFFQSEWWQRVWTWQEMALPYRNVSFMAEAETRRLHTTNTITTDDLEEFGSILISHILYIMRHKLAPEYVGFETSDEVCNRLNDVYAARACNAFRIIMTRSETLYFVIGSLVSSNRRCYDPCDYVYGVLGAMQIKIPRMTDPNDVWRHFLSKLDDLAPLDSRRWMDYADEIDLGEVENIGVVYNELIQIGEVGKNVFRIMDAYLNEIS
ncbi:hypothetical protein O0I10_011451 [Lichtheimia ornata]|uniref:Heterokaryon incompatibility domain-containing protein n=1 Tax=Lichtheimia ornata TaxID=688661 RepID=A0AAD7UT21_9FUNG|nr:uncharacterized protein O0I10_011451 [Lichtheimia ornata]KAJ8652917.1 hypothetical protein O0I10_011451 [Lichtheimia ornata]